MPARRGTIQPDPRVGFYRLIDTATRACLLLRCDIVWPLSVLALSVCLSSVPLYRSVKQEFIPTNVDEAEFEVSVNGPEGTNLAVMNEVMTAMEKGFARNSRCALGACPARAVAFLGGVNQGGAYVRIAPHEERTSRLGRLD